MTTSFLKALLLNPATGSSSLAPFGVRAESPNQSGSETRTDGRVSCGYSLQRGRRPNMEDTHVATFKHDPRSGQVVGCFAIMDGHGGPHAADYVRCNVYQNLLQTAKFPLNVPGALVDVYESTDAQYLRMEGASSRDDGCTAVTAVLLGNRLWVANVGDSRAVLCRAGKAVPLSTDHKPNLKTERERVEAAGGCVVWAGTWRVGGVLAVSRAFGDRPLKRWIISTPDIHQEQLGTQDEFLLLASDGLWDVMSNEEAVAAARDIADPERAARHLTEEAIAKGSNDNVSVIVVRFRL